MRLSGSYISLGIRTHYIPAPLPPQNPPLHLDSEMIALYGEAMHQLGRLEEMLQRIPDTRRFLIAYITKEALVSSQIEGINTTLTEVFEDKFKQENPRTSNTASVLNYIEAVQKALTMLRTQDLPLSIRVLKESHKVLLSNTRGRQAFPGAFRQQQVHVGNLTPAPAPEIPHLMADLEKFINEDLSTLPLIKAGLAHAQFEIIHPFLDGNGRIGRLLIVLMMVYYDIISEPVLYLSYYFKKHCNEYYQLLDRVRTHGDWETWSKYYLKAVAASAEAACDRANAVEALEKELTRKIALETTGRSVRDALNLLAMLFHTPIVSINDVMAQNKTSYNTAKNLVFLFIEWGILRPTNDEQKRNKSFVFSEYIDLLDREYNI